MTTAPVLVPVLGDQLSHGLSSLADRAPGDTMILMMELWDETQYVRHHKAKIAMIFSAMRHFAQELRDKGFSVDYVTLDDPANTGTFTGEVARAITRHGPRGVQITEPGEWRVKAMVDAWRESLGLRVRVLPDTRFVCPLPDFFQWAAGRKQWRMEFFYRDMRRKTGLLMEGDNPKTSQPVGGKWNFDADNRGGPDADCRPPAVARFTPDAITQEVLDLVATRFKDHFGSLDHFAWPVTAAQARHAFDRFLKTRLPLFGRYQDAMMAGTDTMYHAVISPALNIGLIDPVEMCRLAETEWREGRAPIEAVEGFIRQVIGWREYIRGIYWLTMPDLAQANHLDATRPLPEFWWTGETDMACIADCVRATHKNAYAHHIQRLMVMGNFALLAGLSPPDVADWFLAVYADAFEWVELPNVAGMALYADGGKLASKPYAASGAYIDRMSDYCGTCTYDVKRKTGENACPFNALYWDFLARNEAALAGNARLANPFATWRRMSAEKQAEYRDSAAAFLKTLEPARKGWARA